MSTGSWYFVLLLPIYKLYPAAPDTGLQEITKFPEETTAVNPAGVARAPLSPLSPPLKIQLPPQGR